MSLVCWRRSARTAAVLTLVVAALGSLAPAARADEQRVSRLGLALSVMPTSLALGDVNSEIDRLNAATGSIGPPFSPQAPIGKITWDGLWQAELKYFVKRKVAVVAGIGQIKHQSQLELMPVADGSTIIRAYTRAVPIHLGADYYFDPHTSGDFTLRPFVGAGYMKIADTKTSFGYQLVRPDSVLRDFTDSYGNGHGFYVEGGIHMMFPSRYSVIVNANYRNAHVRQMQFFDTGQVVLRPDGELLQTDLSGFGLRFALQMNLFGKAPE